MSQTISRMYRTLEEAESARAALESAEYSDIHLVPGDTGGASHDEITATIARGNILKSHARVYAEGVSRGLSLLTVHAPFSGGLQAQEILSQFDSVDSGVPEPSWPMRQWDEAAPLSSMLNLRVLLDCVAPLSHFLGLPVLTGAAWRHTSFGFPMLTSKVAPLSAILGLPMLCESHKARS